MHRCIWIAIALGASMASCRTPMEPSDPVVESAALGQTSQLRQLLASGSPANAHDRNGFTALVHAARNGHVPAIQALVASGADPNLAAGRNGWTPLLHAIHKHQIESVTSLLALGADVDASGRSGITPVTMAAGYGQADIVRLLLSHGADVGNSSRGEPLRAAVTGVLDLDCITLGGCQTETVRRLLQHEPRLHEVANTLGPIKKLYVRVRCKDMANLLWPPAEDLNK